MGYGSMWYGVWEHVVWGVEACGMGMEACGMGDEKE